MNWTSQSKYLFSGFIIFCLLEITYHVYMNEVITKQIQDTITELYNNSIIHYKRNENLDFLNESHCDNPKQLTNLNDFFNYGKANGKASCINIAEVGGHLRKFESIFPYNEGARIACLDGIKRDDCVVLSFGIGFDNSFDNDVENIAGCKVYMFDPTIQVKSFKNSPNTEFYNMGLSDRKGEIEIDSQLGPQLCQVDRYEGILQMLNLTNHSIDYLKIDIDGSEVSVLTEIFDTSLHLLKNVKQIGMEIHPIITKRINGQTGFIEAFQPYWDVLQRLECLGYDLISFVPNLISVCIFNYMGHEASGCYDVVFSKRIEHVKGLYK